METTLLQQCQDWPKIISHEHLDCSDRPYTILDLGIKEGADLPARFVTAWKQSGNDEAARVAVAVQYQNWVAGFAAESLDNYLKAIVDHVLPVMQTQDNLYRITKERIEDAVADNIIALKLRFAPQLHRRLGLTLQQVIDPVQQAVSEAPFPVRLVICALRHENGRLAWHLANATIRNPLVSTFDLAGSETMFPGVLPWWARQAKRVHEAGKQVDCHLGESHKITDADHDLLDSIGCRDIAHGFDGDPRDKLCQICVESNIVTGQVPDTKSHRIDAMYRAGKKVSVDIDGTLFTRITATLQYFKIAQAFGWGAAEFLRCNLNALEHFPVEDAIKAPIAEKLQASYRL